MWYNKKLGLRWSTKQWLEKNQALKQNEYNPITKYREVRLPTRASNLLSLDVTPYNSRQVLVNMRREGILNKIQKEDLSMEQIEEGFESHQPVAVVKNNKVLLLSDITSLYIECLKKVYIYMIIHVV